MRVSTGTGLLEALYAGVRDALYACVRAHCACTVFEQAVFEQAVRARCAMHSKFLSNGKISGLLAPILPSRPQ